MTYRRFQAELNPGPLRGPNGLAWSAGLGAAKDTLVELAKDAVYAGGARDAEGLGREAPSDGLARLGADAQLVRLFSESDASYRARLAGAWDSWGWLGTGYGLGYALSLVSVRGARIVAQYEWTPPDGLTADWSRFWVLIGVGTIALGSFFIGPWATLGALASPWALLVIGSFTIGSGVTIGSTATANDIYGVRRMLADAKCSRDRVPEAIVASGAILGTVTIGTFTLGGASARWTKRPILGAFVIGARPVDDPHGPWWPRLGRSLFV